MREYFSKRHNKAILNQALPLEFPGNLRVSILRTLEKFSDFGGWNSEENFSFENTKETLKTFYGQENLAVNIDGNERVSLSISVIILKGTGDQLIDVVEAWFQQARSKEQHECEHDLNICLKINNCPWRFVVGEALLVSSEYLTEEVAARLLRLSKYDLAYGELSEFRAALMHLQSGDTHKAVCNAHGSVIHVIKKALGLNGDYSLDEVMPKLIESGVISKYYSDFLSYFNMMVQGALLEASVTSADADDDFQEHVPRNLAELIVNLSGAINLFVIQSSLSGAGFGCPH